MASGALVTQASRSVMMRFVSIDNAPHRSIRNPIEQTGHQPVGRHDVLHFRIEWNLGGLFRQGEVLYRCRWLQLQRQLLLELPDGGEILVQALAILCAPLTHQPLTIILHGRQHTLLNHGARVWLELGGVRILKLSPNRP